MRFGTNPNSDADTDLVIIRIIKKIKAPIIWSLQDMWPFTGGCHFNEGCFRYEINCGNCKVLSSKHEHDLSRLIFNRKKRNFIEIEKNKIIWEKINQICLQKIKLLCLMVTV